MAGSHASEFVGERAGYLGEKIRELSDRERGARLYYLVCRFNLSLNSVTAPPYCYNPPLKSAR